MLKHHTL